MHRLAILASLSAVAVLSLPVNGAGAAQTASRLCANTYGGDVISATIVGCRKARRVVRTWGHRYKRDGRINRTVLRFRCRGRNDQFEGLTIRCRRANARIRFYANVP
jgi:hypothetical protein